MKLVGIIAGRLQKTQDQPIGDSALELVRLAQGWAEADELPDTEKQADVLARFAMAAIWAFGKACERGEA